ncbi:hypothetical protein Tco_0281504 [Tanacetum coccineum]
MVLTSTANAKKRYICQEEWDAIKYRFGGNDEIKGKCQKSILKKQSEGFYCIKIRRIHKGYDRFQSLLSQLEIHGARCITMDATQIFLRSLSFLPRSKVYLIMRLYCIILKHAECSVSSLRTPAVLMIRNGLEMAGGHDFNEDEKVLQKDRELHLSDASIEIKNITQRSKNVEAQLVASSTKGHLWYGDHRYDGILSYENEVLQSVFMNKESELVNQPLYDRFVTTGGMHAVPPPMTGNYMPSGPDVEIDYSQFTYDCSVETNEPLLEPTVNKPKVVCQPKVWSDAPIIEEYESDSEDEHVSQSTEEQETPSFANKQVKTPRETVKNHFTHSKNSTVDKKGLGYV